MVSWSKTLSSDPFVLFCFVLISFKLSKVQRFSQLVILEDEGGLLGWLFLGTTQCVVGKSSGKGGAWCLQSSRKSYPGTGSSIFAVWELIIKYQMSWLRVFSSLSGSLSLVVYSLSPPHVFPGQCWCERRQRGWLYWIILAKKYCFSEQFFLLLLTYTNISVSLSGPAVQDHRVVLWWEPVFCIRSDGLSFNIHQLWAASLS